MSQETKFYPKWRVEIKDGDIVFQDKESFYNHLVPFEGKEMHLVIRHIHKDRSRQEEKFYHAVVVRMVAGAMDISDQEAHELLKKLFLTSEEKSPKGFRYTRTLSTTELTDREYREYWEKCIRWAALPTKEDGLGPDSGLGLYIPYPNEVDYQSGRDY